MKYSAVSFDPLLDTPWMVTALSNELPSEPGLFETFRLEAHGSSSYKGFAIHRHYSRIHRSLNPEQQDRMPSFEAFLKGIQIGLLQLQIRRRVPLKVRFQIVENNYPSIIIEKFQPRLKPSIGARLISYEGLRSSKAGTKFLPATQSLASYSHALQHLADEALLLSANKTITETSWANFFAVHPSGSIITSGKCLPGVTRYSIIDLYKNNVEIKELSLESFFNDGCSAFITNSLHDVIPVINIDGIPLPSHPLIQEVVLLFSSKRSLFEEAIFFYAK